MFEKPSKCSETAPSAPFRVLCARESENHTIETLSPRPEILPSTLPPQGVENPLYLVPGRKKGLGRDLMHPCPQPPD